jgi:ATP-binding cassette subfamily B protein
MAEGTMSAEEKAAAQRRGPAPPRGGGPGSGLAVPAEKPTNFRRSAKRLLWLLRPDRAALLVVLVLSTVSVVLNAIGPFVLARATDLIFAGFFGRQLSDEVSQAQAATALRAQGEDTLADMVAAMDYLVPGQGIDFRALAEVLALVMGIYVVAALLSWVQGRLLVVVVNRTIFTLRRDVEAKLHRLPLPYFDRQPRGEVLSRVTNDIDNVAQSLQQTLSQLLTSLLTVVAMVTMMFVISPTLALVALVTIPVSVLVTGVIGKRAQGHFKRQWKHTGEVNGVVEESFTGHELIKVFGRQEESRRTFDRANTDLYAAGFGAQFVSGIIMPTMMFVGNLNYVVIAVLGGLRVASGTMSLGEVQAFIQYSRQFTQPLTQVASMANLMQSGVASAERVFEVLDTPEQAAESPSPVRLEAPRGRVEFEDVAFAYDPDRPLIHDLNLCVEPGQTVAIVGPTGAGKTTLVNLLMRFYELDAGRITLDGVDITDLTRDDLRSRIGMVLQDTWLFQGTIRDNIVYGRPDATEEELQEAAVATYVDRFVRSLPDGYDTLLDSEGGNISTGEKQLVTIARAFLSDPALLILDEATSSVDTRTELLLQQAMAALRSDRTSFVIAHRLSTVRDADLILMMEDGAIVEQGTHDTLLERGGAYARLYQSQFAAAAAEVDEDAEPTAAVPRAPQVS